MPGLCLRKYVEGRGTGIGVERAKAGVVTARSTQVYLLGDDVYDVESAFYLLRNTHRKIGLTLQLPAKMWR